MFLHLLLLLKEPFKFVVLVPVDVCEEVRIDVVCEPVPTRIRSALYLFSSVRQIELFSRDRLLITLGLFGAATRALLLEIYHLGSSRRKSVVSDGLKPRKDSCAGLADEAGMNLLILFERVREGRLLVCEEINPLNHLVVHF